MIYPYNGVLVSNENEQTIDTPHNTMDKSEMLHAKKPDAKGPMFYYHILKTFWKRKTLRTENKSMIARS